MHEPRPYGLTVVGGKPSEEDSAAIELLARRLTNLKSLSGVESLRMVRDLPHGGYVIAQDAGGTFRCIVHKPEPDSATEAFDGTAGDHVPMLFSGVVTNAILRRGEGLGLRLSRQCVRRLGGYGVGVQAGMGVVGADGMRAELQRFRIDYHASALELKPDVIADVLYTQYAAQRPTWYSGAMAEVMQIVGGYGRQDLEALPDTPVERARMSIPSKIMAKIREEIGNVRLPGYTGKPDERGQFQYDYKFNNTHAVGFDTSNKPWLLRVHSSGVWAMPLPMIPATTTRAFREHMEEVGDQEIIAILDRFGGMPSGESFPVREEAIQAWRRAGAIIKVCDTADFYQHIMYSSACGWSFNSRGTEGYNTCYDYYDDEGLGYGLAYKMVLQLAPARDGGSLRPIPSIADPQAAQRLDQYLGSLYQLLSGNDARSLAIKYKMRRVDPAQILARAHGKAGEADVAYWDALELDPIATHSGSVSEVGRGYLYSGAKFQYQPQIKFPEPFMGGCVSHDFLPLINGRYKESYPNSDTIMFGYYVGDELKVVKYFREGRAYQQEVQSDFEECMTVGSWTKVSTTGSTSLLGSFYSSDIDERKAMAPVTETTKVEGRDLGYSTLPHFAFDDFFSTTGSLWRFRYFSRKTSTHRTESASMAVAVCIPYLNRNALLHAKEESVAGESFSESMNMLSVRDPHSYRYYTYDFLLAWMGGSTHGNAENASGFSPAPKDGNPVWVVARNYDPSPCSDFADQGPWIPSLPADYTWLIHPKKNEWHHSGGGGEPAFKSYSTGRMGPRREWGDLQISIDAKPEIVHREKPSGLYFLGSPDPYVGVFYRDACKVTFGSVTYSNVSENDGELRKRWGHTRLADHKSAHHFIGVINE